MFGSDHEQKLARLFEPRAMPRPGHRDALEAELLRRFSRLHEERRRYEMQRRKRILRRALFGAALAAAASIAACATPMDVEVEVGRSLAIEYQAGEGMPEPKVVLDALHGAGELQHGNVRVMRKGDAITIRAEVWGKHLDEGSLGDHVKEAVPALANAKVVEEPIEGKVRSTLGMKLGHELLDLDIADEQDIEAVRQKILEKLAAQGVEGEVDVQVEGDGVRERKVKIQVKRADGEPGLTEP
jgi:hypothetical protein